MHAALMRHQMDMLEAKIAQAILFLQDPDLPDASARLDAYNELTGEALSIEEFREKRDER